MKNIVGLLMLLMSITLIKESNAQKLNTKWIQEFETKMNIIDVPLVEGDYVYVHLKKGGNEFGGGTHFLQKRKISDNSLVKEIEINFIGIDGKQMTFFEYDSQGIQEINSELYIIASYNSKKSKKGVVYAYKLNKEKMAFELGKTIFETPISKEEVSAYSFVLRQEDDELIVMNVTKSAKKSDEDYYFTISKEGINELDDKTYSSYDILFRSLEKRDVNVMAEPYLEKMAPKISHNNTEYIECHTFHNKELENEVNFYGLAREKDPEEKIYKVYAVNYNSNQYELMKGATYENYYLILGDRTINDLSLYDEFQLKSDKNDIISIFKIGNYIFFTKIDKWTRQGAKVGDGYELLENLGGIQIACVNEKEGFKWEKRIARTPYIVTGEKQSYYQFLHNDKLILLYCNAYLIIDVNTGENKILSNEDFSLQNNFEIKLGTGNNESIVYTRHKRNKKQIGIIQFED